MLPPVGDHTSSFALMRGDLSLQAAVEMRLPVEDHFLDVFLILFQNVVSFRCFGEAGEEGKRLSNVQCLKHVSKTSVLCLSCLLLMLCMVIGMLCFNVPTRKAEMRDFLCFLYTMGLPELGGNSKI